jgi:hypothetical protein
MGILTPAKTSNMKDEKIYSPIEDTKITTNLMDSPIWSLSYHETDVAEASKKHPILFEYIIRFNGLTPIQLLKVSKYSK